MYVVLMGGDVVQGAGRTVYLLRDDAALLTDRVRFCRAAMETESRLRDSLAAALAPMHDSLDRAEPEVFSALNQRRRDTLKFSYNDLSVRYRQRSDDGLRAQAMWRAAAEDSAHALAVRHSVASVSSGLHAHFRFDSIPPGDYVLYSTWNAHGRPRRFWSWIHAKPGELLKRDLDNEWISERWLNCTLQQRNP